MLRINSIEINAIGGIENLTIPFNEGFNLICGPNGIGKTTILDCISQSVSGHSPKSIRRKSSHNTGVWTTKMVFEGTPVVHQSSIKIFHPHEPLHASYQILQRNFDNYQELSASLITYKTNRYFEHLKVDSIKADKKEQEDSISAINGVLFGSTKNWFINRQLFSAHQGTLSHNQLKNLELAKGLFSALDTSVCFKTMKADTFDIILSTKDGSDIYFEYLSSGFKSSLYILFSLIKEIEYRFKDPDIYVCDFNGVLIIDELDLHLHPEWQARMIRVLKNLIPKAQIIATTHSPHMLQVSDANEVIPLGFDQTGNVILRKVDSNEYGFQGWSVEEILTDVMGLDNVHSELYITTIKSFEVALDEDNKEKAEKAFKILDKMLHPRNHLRKILKIQMASLGDLHDKNK